MPLACLELINTFQSTRPRRARRSAWSAMEPLCTVSIHAPAKGATLGRPRQRHRPSCFNPRAREGRDPDSFAVLGHAIVFQSTRPRRARLRWRHKNGVEDLFQSTRPRRARPYHGKRIKQQRHTRAFPRTVRARDAPKPPRKDMAMEHPGSHAVTRIANPPVFQCPLEVRGRPERYKISGASGSYEGFAPTCSTFGRQFLPRK